MKEELEKSNVFEIYWQWKQLDQTIRKLSDNGVEFPKYISYKLCSVLNDYLLKINKREEGYAVSRSNEIVWIGVDENVNHTVAFLNKRKKFDIFEFVKLDYANDIFYFYRITSNNINKLFYNNKFNINQIIKELNLSSYAKTNMKTKEIVF